MSKARLVITAVVVEGRSQAEVARTYGVSPGWVSKLVARYRSEGEAALEPRSRRPKTSPNAVAATVVGQIVELRTTLVAAGLDAGPDTIRWHLEQHHSVRVSSATISRYLAKARLVTPQPQKKPRSSYIRFEADQPNECWQSDFTHYRLVTASGAPGAHVDPLLAGRPLPQGSVGHGSPADHRTDRPRLLQGSRCLPWSSSLDVD